MKKCKTCGKVLVETEFQFRPHSGTYRTSCRQCESKARSGRTVSGESKQQKYLRALEREKEQRSNPTFRGRFIYRDSKKYDQRNNLENDLTQDYIEEIIKNGCMYCGDTTKMTLDRIDNNYGHTMANIVPCCYRCNIIRSTMPYTAWLNIAPSVRDTFQKGLFATWQNIGTMPREKKRK